MANASTLSKPCVCQNSRQSPKPVTTLNVSQTVLVGCGGPQHSLKVKQVLAVTFTTALLALCPKDMKTMSAQAMVDGHSSFECNDSILTQPLSQGGR